MNTRLLVAILILAVVAVFAGHQWGAESVVCR